MRYLAALLLFPIFAIVQLVLIVLTICTFGLPIMMLDADERLFFIGVIELWVEKIWNDK